MKQAMGFGLTQHLPLKAVLGLQKGRILKDWPWHVTVLIRILQRSFIWHKDKAPSYGLYLPTSSK